METKKKKYKAKKGLREYHFLGCPLTHNRSPWCFRLCTPETDGQGYCGRIAPHSLKGKTQLSIEKHKQKLLREHCEKLENMYLNIMEASKLDPCIAISEGTAEIVIPVHENLLNKAGTITNAISFQAMEDSTFLAVSSLAAKVHMTMISFNTYLTGACASGELVARARIMNISGDQYLAESVLTDAEGKEIGRGNGVYTPSDIQLTKEMGYTDT